MNFLHIILPVATGALIGYCTNYIAIKMLFLPRKEVWIGKCKLPFTPGVIPKNKPRIASAVGTAISEKLLTQNDIAESIKNSSIKENAVSSITDFLMQDATSLKNIIADLCPNKDIKEIKDYISVILSGKIIDGIKRIDMKAMVSDIAVSSFHGLLSNPLVSMLMGGNAVNAVSDKICNAINEYIDQHGQEAIVPLIKKEIDDFLSESLKNNLAAVNIDEELIRKTLANIAEKLIDNNISKLIGGFKVKEIVEEKINEMDVKELEELVMSVMKNELQAVINLGAVIGAIIGIINIFT